MNMKICQNIDLVQIDIESNYGEATSYGMSFQLPKNVDWANRVVDKIVVAAPFVEHNRPGEVFGSVLSPLQSPINGIPVLGSMDFLQKVPGKYEDEDVVSTQGIYFDLYRKDGGVLAKNLSILSILSRNNNILDINAQLDLEQSRIFIPGKFVNSGCLLLYVFYGGYDDASFEYPTESITVKLNLAGGQKMSFFEIINNYVHIQPNKIRGIRVWNVTNKSIFDNSRHMQLIPNSDAGVFFTLRDFNRTYSINNVIDTIFTEYQYADQEVLLINDETLVSKKRSQLYFNADIDFDNSFLQNGYEKIPTEVTIIFSY